MVTVSGILTTIASIAGVIVAIPEVVEKFKDLKKDSTGNKKKKKRK